ncbi:hypothetical protein Tco_0103149 [Tanacetum coccineum]
MSDSEDSTVTYTKISSPYEDLSDIGSPGAEGPIFQDPPSLDYVPGPLGSRAAPPFTHLCTICFRTCLTEFLTRWTMFLAGLRSIQLPVAAIPTTESPGYHS